jgi:branched-chain amino acid transport system permease protein
MRRPLLAAGWAALFIFAFVFPAFTSYHVTSVATNALIYAIAAYGLFFLYSQSGQLSAAHAALMGVGAYVVALFDLKLGLSLWVALPVAIVACFFAGILLGLPSRRISGHYFLIVTFAFTQVFILVLLNWNDLTNGTDGLSLTDLPPNPGFDIGTTDGYYRLCLIALAITLGAIVLLRRTRFCKLLRSARESEPLALALGMDVHRHRLLAFGISAIFPGLAGGLYVYYLSHIEPASFGITGSVNLILMLILGGSLVLLGPLVGALAFGFLPDVINLEPSVTQMVFGALLVLVILAFPRGIAGGALDSAGRFAGGLGKRRASRRRAAAPEAEVTP